MEEEEEREGIEDEGFERRHGSGRERDVAEGSNAAIQTELEVESPGSNVWFTHQFTTYLLVSIESLYRHRHGTQISSQLNN